jgi:hypothetical protein
MKGIYRDLGLNLCFYSDAGKWPSFLSQSAAHKEMIFTTIGQTSKLLFTCRKSVYKEASKLGAFVTENIVDLQSKANQLTETEKMAIDQLIICLH